MKVLALVEAATLDAQEHHAEAFKALAHTTRLRIFYHLVRARQEVSAGAIQQAVGVPAPTLSHHLDTLEQAGLVRSRHEGRFIYYAVERDAVKDLVRLLTACC